MSDPYAPGRMSNEPVAEELQRLSTHYGFVAIDNVRITRGLISVVVDHVLVDRYGVLIIDGEDRTGSTITGSDSDKEWLAVHSSGLTAKFGNPLYLNVGNENVIRQALADSGVNLDSTQVRSAVIFVGADLSKLSLVEVNAMKVTDLSHVADVLEARYNFPPNNGQLTAGDVDRIVALLSAYARPLDAGYMPEDDSVPWSQDPAVVAGNASRMSRETSPTPLPSRDGTPSMSAFTAPAELAGHLTGAGDAPTLGSAFLVTGTIIIIVLAVTAGFAFFPQLQAGSILVWTAAWVVLVAVAELVAASLATVPRKDGRPAPRSLGRLAGGFLSRVVLVAVFVAGMWVLLAGGAAQQYGERLAEQFAPAVQSVVLPKNQGPTAARANETLLQRYPEVFKTVDRDKPVVVKLDNGGVTYTWPYTSGDGSFTLTLSKTGGFVSGKESAQ